MGSLADTPAPHRWAAFGRCRALLICLAICSGATALEASEAQALPAPRRFESHHEATIAGQRIRYDAVVAEHFILDPAGKRAAGVFTTSYLRTDKKKSAQRPVIFIFNGGPGSASLWLHMGLVGPRRVDLPDAVNPPTVPPFRTVSNDESLIDVADLVLIDPPGTGHSRILADGKPEQFYGTQQDAAMTVTLLQQWIREHARWNSPKFLLSESYGTVRAAVVARLLAGGPSETGNMESVTLNGLIQLGQAMDLTESAGTDGAILNALPTLAATACYHKRIAQPCTAQSQIEAARALTSDSYLRALRQGTRLSAAEREAVARSLATLTGLSPQFILENDLRIQPAAFAKQLLADQNKEVGLYDGRFTLPLAASGHDPVADDPAMGQYVPAFVAAYNDYAHGELGVKIDDEYQPIAFRSVNGAWDYGRGPGAGADRNAAQDLAVAMRRNPHLRLMIATGYYDLVTTLGSAEYTVAHAGIPMEATEFHLYAAGHMPYLGDESRRALARDVRAFVSAAVSH